MAELKPTSYPDWATDDVTLPVAGTANKIEPRPIMQTQGADKGNFFGAQEANWVLNSNGKWVRYLAQEVQHLNDTNLREHPSVADMIADVLLVEGNYVRTLGYHTLGDTGGAIYEVVSSGLADGMTTITLDNGLLANFVYTSNVFSPIQFGAAGDGITDDSVPIQKIADSLEENPSEAALQQGVVIDLHGKTYRANIVPQYKLTIKNGTLSQVASGSNIIEHVEGDSRLANPVGGWDNIVLYNVVLDGKDLGTTYTQHNTENSYTLVAENMGVYLNVASTSVSSGYGLTIEGCTFKGFTNSNIALINTVALSGSSDEEPVQLIDTIFNNVTTNQRSINTLLDTLDVSRKPFKLTRCKYVGITTSLIYNRETRVVCEGCEFNVEVSLQFDGDALFLGYGKVDLSDNSEVNTTVPATMLTRFSYDMSISDSQMGDTVIESSYHTDKYAKVYISNSTLESILIQREGDPAANTRPTCDISFVNCRADLVDIVPEDPNNSESVASGVVEDSIRWSNNSFKDWHISYTTFPVFNINLTGNTLRSYTDNSHGRGVSANIILPSGSGQMVALSGNTFDKEPTSLISNIIDTLLNNVDTSDYYAVLENSGVVQNMVKGADGTLVTRKYGV